MSQQNVQSRFIVDLEKIETLIDTPNNTIQGFVVNMNCDRFEEIFDGGDQAITLLNNNLWLFIDNRIDLEEIDANVSMKFLKIYLKCSR